MKIKRTLGGNRLGSGKGMQVNLHGFGRSSFNLNQVFKTDQAAGTGVPCFIDIATNGGDYYIKLDSKIRTLPTNGPIFGVFKHQIDIFQIPLRLYNAELHNNMLGIGLRMKDVKFPITKYIVQRTPDGSGNLEQVAPDSLTAYLGIMGFGKKTATTQIYRKFPAIFDLAYWDCYKNYYANKQEEIGYVITGGGDGVQKNNWLATAVLSPADGQGDQQTLQATNNYTTTGLITFEARTNSSNDKNRIRITFNTNATEEEKLATIIRDPQSDKEMTIIEFAKTYNTEITTLSQGSINIRWTNASDELTIPPGFQLFNKTGLEPLYSIKKFELKNIDDMRTAILKADSGTPFDITSQGTYPYAASYGQVRTNNPIEPTGNNCYFSQSGLFLKTYQSDRFNNWLSTEWIEGDNGINEITAVQVVDGKITMNALLLQEKLFNMYNRIAVSGGSYDDWQEVSYGEQTVRKAESPIYEGGMSSEIYFDEVVSTSDAGENDPLGSLAGRGSNDHSKRGANSLIHIHVMEPSIIMAIESITPRVTYSQGNEWFTNLETMDDLHQPGLDGIGFQNLITEEMAAYDTIVNANGTLTKFSAGKQLSWTQYMTKVDKAFGSFAKGKELEHMTLNRGYEQDPTTGRIKDLTTYIDPTKFNIAFADAKLSAKNFWVQIGIECTARRKMSANQMPIM